MTWLNTFLSLLAVLGLAATAFGWRHSLRWNERGPEFFFALAKVLYSIGIGGRIILWDIVVGQVRDTDPELADAIYSSIGGTDANIVPSIIILAGVYCSLRARHLLIRPDERRNWPWFLSWLHPKRPIWRR